MNAPHFVVIWEFQIKLESGPAFEEIYGSGGGWAQLFGRSPDYLGTKLVCDLSRPGRYVTLDFWTSRAALHQFKQDHAGEYATLDRQCESLTERETMVGEFEDVMPG